MVGLIKKECRKKYIKRKEEMSKTGGNVEVKDDWRAFQESCQLYKVCTEYIQVMVKVFNKFLGSNSWGQLLHKYYF